MTPHEFVSRWQAAGGREIANSQSFLLDLCELLGVEKPQPTVADDSANTYVFEKGVTFQNGDGTTSQGRVDLYRQGCFVLESKQGSERKSAEEAEALAEVTKNRRLLKGTAERGSEAWRQAMTKAFRQAKRYAEALPEWPPFLVVADIGHCLDVYADFSGTGKLYQPFPDPKTYRIPLRWFVDGEYGEQTLAQLKAMWVDPLSLDPSKRSAKATRDLAAKLAELAKRLEGQTDDDGEKKYTPDVVAQFLMRCLFTMFAEDLQVGGLKKKDFEKFLVARRADLSSFVPMVEALWSDMNEGKYSIALSKKLAEFNGGLFSNPRALPLTLDQLELLIQAAGADWSDVEPAIFGTLLERALDPHERHKLGAHYTPRAYVERLVMPTIIEPLREEWEDVYAEAMALSAAGKAAGAQKVVQEFHAKLCETRVLDPACGSGNFLYVALELMKRLEGEVLNALKEFGENQLPLLTIDPHQFLGIEVNPRAAAIADLVLWIGYLQWHFRTRGPDTLAEPIIRKFHNIECRDAVLAWDAVEPVVDADGKPVTRWDGRTTKTHPVTGEEVPDEAARVQELRYVNPRKAEWPKADYIVGNPPFIGDKKMRLALGDGYVTALRDTYEELSGSADFVMYFWDRAAEAVRTQASKRFGVIGTNSLRQTYNSRVVKRHLMSNMPMSLIFAVPDHPWIDSSDGAAVRISMTVGVAGNSSGVLMFSDSSGLGESRNAELDSYRSVTGEILSNLTVGADVTSAVRLRAADGLCNVGVALHASGLALTEDEAESLLSDAKLAGIRNAPMYVRPIINGRDVAQTRRNAFALDLFEVNESDLQQLGPIYQWVLTRVLPERQNNPRASYRKKWWVFGEARQELRLAIRGLERYIITPMVARHRYFAFFDSHALPDQKLVTIATESPFVLGILSSRAHVTWAHSLSSRIGVGNDLSYNKGRCFQAFPFPSVDSSCVSDAAENLDAHRKRQQGLHPDLTLTGMYNVLEKLRSGEALTKKEQVIHEQGLVSVLKQIHDELDAAVFEAYGWPVTLTDEEILERLVALNHERAAEEARGIVRWLRPEFQNPGGDGKTQQRLAVEEADEEEEPVVKGRKGAKGKVSGKSAAGTAGPTKRAWPGKLAERIKAVRLALAEAGRPASVEEIAGRFVRPKKEQVGEVLEVLLEVGQARLVGKGRFVA